MRLRLHLFWVKMISGNHFHPFPHVWLQRKIQFSGNCIPVDQNLPLWPGNEFTFSFSLQFISGSLSTHSNTERKREEKHKTNAHTATQRAPIHAQQHREKERTSSDPHFISPIHSDPRTREVRSTHSNTGRNRERASIQSDPRTRELRSKTFYLIPVCVLIKKKRVKKRRSKAWTHPLPHQRFD